MMFYGDEWDTSVLRLLKPVSAAEGFWEEAAVQCTLPVYVLDCEKDDKY